MQELQALWSLDNDIRGEVFITDKYVLQIGCIGSMKKFESLAHCFLRSSAFGSGNTIPVL